MAPTNTTASHSKMKKALEAAQLATLDDDIDDQSVQAAIVHFMRRLVGNTQAKSALAYHIAHFIEDNADFIPELADIFPQSRQTHMKRAFKDSERMTELKAEIATIKADINRLNKTKKVLIGTDLDEVKKEIANHHEDIEHLNSEIATLKEDEDYKPVYPASGLKAKYHSGVAAADWEVLQTTLATIAAQNKPQSDFYKNLDMLTDNLQFSPHEKALLRLLITLEENTDFGNMLNNFAFNKMKATYDLMARMTDIPRKDVTIALAPEAALTVKGLILPMTDYDEYDAHKDSALPFLSTQLISLLKEPDLTMDTVARRLIGEPVTTALDWDRDFQHLGEPGRELIRIMSGTMKSGATGVNFLLHGLPDSGKTEAVKAAAKKTGLTLYMVGECSTGRTEPSRSERIQSALMAQAILGDRKDTAILFDEMEDVLPNVGGSIFSPPPSAPTGISKVFLNRMLESNKTMTFWTANDPERFHPAVKRRMRFSLEFNVPPASVRQQMWESISLRHNFNLSAEDSRKLAREYKAPPGMIDTAIRNAVQTGEVATIRTSLAASADLVFGSRNAILVRNNAPDYYNQELIRAKVEDSDVTIHELTNRIEALDARNFSMLLFGDPGTGKSAYAVHLANRLGMEVCLKKASDILGKYVGENEQNIAAAFKEALDGQKFLIIDEADTFLSKRSGAEKSWEISMVNEMLTQMESHPLPFAMTTNLYQEIDPAAKRRFLFKLHFSPMDATQTKLAFSQFFGVEAPDSLLQGNIPLTPADFALVQRQRRFLLVDADAERLASLVKAEAKSRMAEPPRLYNESRSGFTAQLPERKLA